MAALHPFKRINALVAAYNAAVELANVADPTNVLQVSETRDRVMAADAALRDYKSRGHGWAGTRFWRTITGRWNASRSIWDPHQGKKEIEKRGGIAPSQWSTGKTSAQLKAQRASQARWNSKVEAENRSDWEDKLLRRERRRTGTEFGRGVK